MTRTATPQHTITPPLALTPEAIADALGTRARNLICRRARNLICRRARGELRRPTDDECVDDLRRHGCLRTWFVTPTGYAVAAILEGRRHKAASARDVDDAIGHSFGMGSGIQTTARRTG